MEGIEAMEGITITPDKVLDCYWDRKNKKYKRVAISPKTLYRHTWRIVTLDRVTLERLFSIVESNIDMWELLLCENIRPFLQEAQQPLTEDIAELKHLEIFWDAEVNVVDGCRDFTFSPTLMGLMEDSVTGEEIDMGVEFTPVNNLMKYEIRLRPQVEVVVVDYDGFKQTGEWQQLDNIALGERPFTVLEVFKAVFEEISFWGNPTERDKWLGTIKERILEVQEGTAKLIPWEDVKKKIDKKIEEAKQKKDTLNLLGEDDDTNQNT